MSFSKIFQNCTNARITKCGSCEKQLLVRHVFVKKFRWTTHLNELFKNISTLYPCKNHVMWITWKVIVRESCFCEKIQAAFTIAWAFSKIFQLSTHARITKCGLLERWLFVRHVFVKKSWQTSQFHEFLKNISTLYPC